jgi:RND family efflux transporter MFP subunit
MKKVLRIGLLLLGIAALGYFAVTKLARAGSAEGASVFTSGKGEAGDRTEAEVPVKVVEAVRGDLPLRLTVSGVSEARQQGEVKAEVDGTVERIFAREGERVEAGSVVGQMGSREKELALREAEAVRLEYFSSFLTQYQALGGTMDETRRAAMEESRKRYEKALNLYKDEKLSREDLTASENKLLEAMIGSGELQDQVQRVVSSLTRAEIGLERARLNLEYTRIRAPFSGTIAKLDLALGGKVGAGTTAFRLVNLDSLCLRAFVLETELGRVKPGQEARLRFMAFPEKTFAGRVAAVAPEVDAEKKTAAVLIDFSNPGALRAGMAAEADIVYRVVPGVVKVPRAAILVRSGRPLLFVVEKGQAVWRYLELGAANAEENEVRSGVEPGESVVVDGHLNLAHQARVRVVE